MKPAPFDYYRPDTLEEALELLAQHGSEGKLLAGGQSLLPILNMRLSVQGCLIDINHLKDLAYIRLEDGWLHIGALTRQRDLEKSDLVRAHAPLIAEAVPFIGHVQTRNRGTVGGSLVHADPTAELPLSFLALDGVAVIESAEGKREVALQDFFVTYLTTDVATDELLTEVKIPVNTVPRGYAFTEFSRRHGDFAMVDAGCVLGVDPDHRVTSTRLVIGGVDAVPVVVDSVAELLQGQKLSESLLDELSLLACDNIDPEGDLHGSREYRMNLARVYVKKAVRTAYLRASGREELE
ncbi:FAD binding domain-containing protein [Alicyclobacillus dauci]|uniref:Xanthine dehydrogenase family protein subunit M n=1 Tax=Alicyclobacillus dauci TaxID=1475485 RepID=A0ABY6Z5C2_9BACL|nr:xanthine dehydrogenase family protein subunit M [Alicyclobacillus dauci]WAH38012.1 xanthine dehydrogenase family protein subunit M [Alicyclobacillus dauci]